MRLSVLYVSVLVAFLFSCREDNDSPIGPANLSERSVIILNEGNFRSANASISLFYPELGKVYHDQFSAANQGIPLGDVAQSMSLIKGNYWLVVNNSNRIEVLDPSSLQSVGRVSGLNSPRYAVAGPNQKVYVSDLYEGSIYVVDAVNFTVSSQIQTQGWTEEMEIVGDKLFVCQVDSSQILVINTLTDSIEQRIPTAMSPLSLALDQNNQLWVACSGGINEAEPVLMKVDPSSLNVELELRIADVSKSIGDLATSPDGSELYYLMEDVYKMEVNSTALPNNPWHSRPSTNYYAMAVDPNNGEVYLSDAIDYQQDGAIYRLDSEARIVSQFKAGLIPGFFYFEEP